MIVMGSDGICHVAQHVRQELLPAISDPYLTADLRFTAMCLDLIAEDYDRAVDVMVADREEIAKIFEMVLPHLEGELHARVSLRLGCETKDLRVRSLTQRADQDMSVLIELHCASEDGEQTGRAWTADLNAKIWRFIENYAQRRKYHSPI
jgi:hypothetical protein